MAEWGVLKMNDCNLTTCRYNKDNKCTNNEKRNIKHIGDEDDKPIETSELHDMTIGVDVSVDAVNEYAKSILGRYPKDNIEFSRALAVKVLEETKSLANSEEKG